MMMITNIRICTIRGARMSGVSEICRVAQNKAEHFVFIFYTVYITHITRTCGKLTYNIPKLCTQLVTKCSTRPQFTAVMDDSVKRLTAYYCS